MRKLVYIALAILFAALVSVVDWQGRRGGGTEANRPRSRRQGRREMKAMMAVNAQPCAGRYGPALAAAGLERPLLPPGWPLRHPGAGPAQRLRSLSQIFQRLARVPPC